MEVKKIMKERRLREAAENIQTRSASATHKSEIVRENLACAEFLAKSRPALVVLPVNMVMQKARQNSLKMKRETTRRCTSPRIPLGCYRTLLKKERAETMGEFLPLPLLI